MNKTTESNSNDFQNRIMKLPLKYRNFLSEVLSLCEKHHKTIDTKDKSWSDQMIIELHNEEEQILRKIYLDILTITKKKE